MPIRIQPYTADKIPAVKEFNQRLAVSGIAPEFHFPESHIPHWLPRRDSQPLYQEYFLAFDDPHVRGGFVLKHQQFLLSGKERSIPYYHLPISEGIVDKKFAGVGVHMLRAAMKMEPTLFALGMGGFDRPLPMMLKAMRWQMSAVPFYYRVIHPGRFLRQIGPLRSSAWRRTAAAVSANTGLGLLAINAAQWMRTRNVANESEIVENFGPWSDELWQQCSSHHYAMIAKRDSAVLNILYSTGKNFLRLRVGTQNAPSGWAVLLDTQMTNNKYFGDLRVGSIVDCLAAPENTGEVIAAATRAFEERGVDLVISNHSHAAWRQAFRSAGFFEGPSNFIFAASPELAENLSPFDENQLRVHLNRGDGDGPVNL
jgi:hypothetical protein